MCCVTYVTAGHAADLRTVERFSSVGHQSTHGYFSGALAHVYTLVEKGTLTKSTKLPFVHVL
jgi:hypothetical protein